MNLQQSQLHLKRYSPRLVCKAATVLPEHTLHTEAEMCSSACERVQPYQELYRGGPMKYKECRN